MAGEQEVLRGNFGLRENEVLVNFAGKKYIGHARSIDNLLSQTPKYDCVWGVDRLIDRYKIDGNAKHWKWGRAGARLYTFRESVQEVLDADYSKIDEKYGPIWIIQQFDRWSDIYIAKNPILDRWQFAKALPPQEAFFALRRWVISQHRPEKEIPVVSDNLMAEIKGFSPKTSFRKEKGEGPKRKRKGK